MLTATARHLRQPLRGAITVYHWKPQCASIATASLQCKGHAHWQVRLAIIVELLDNATHVQNIARTKTVRDEERAKMISLYTMRIQKAIMQNNYNTDVNSNRDLAREIEAAKLATVPMETINRQVLHCTECS